MNSIAILESCAQEKRKSAAKAEHEAQDLEKRAAELRALAEADNAVADQIDADIELIRNRGADPEPRVFAGRRKLTTAT